MVVLDLVSPWKDSCNTIAGVYHFCQNFLLNSCTVCYLSKHTLDLVMDSCMQVGVHVLLYFSGFYFIFSEFLLLFSFCIS